MPSKTKPNSRVWFGELGINAGFAYFVGQTGDNRPHAHWAHQCIVRLDQAATLTSAGIELHADAMFVPAGVTHQLIAPRHLSLFFDPTTELAKAICEHITHPTTVQALPQELADFFRNAFAQAVSTLDLDRRCLNYFKRNLIASKLDPRVTVILDQIRLEVGTEHSKRNALAQQIGLSDSRFSHWFREQTGMPLRSYRKWLGLIIALEAILNGSSATEAAYLAGFSDQAHFSRTFLAMFGVTPNSLMPNLARKI